MKLFIKKIVLFTCILSILLAVLYRFLPYNPDGFLREYFVKMKFLEDSSRKPSIILLGGSNVAFGFNSNLVEDSLGIPVYNAGLHAGLGLSFILKDCSRFLKEGDHLILSPEYTHFYNKYAYEGDVLSELFYLAPNYVSSNIVPNQYYILIKDFFSFIQTQLGYTRSLLTTNLLGRKQPDTVYRMSAFNKKGDVIAHWNNNMPLSPYKNEKFNKFGNINITYINEFANQIKTLRNKGIHVTILPPAYIESQFLLHEADIQEVQKRLACVGIQFACEPKETAYANEYFYDTDYHLNEKGAIRRSLQLVTILKTSHQHP